MSLEALAIEAADLAESLLAAAAAIPRNAADRRQERLLTQLVSDAGARRFVFHLTDRVLRCPDPATAARQFRAVLDADGIPAGLPAGERLALRLAGIGVRLSPKVIMPLVQARLRQASRSVVIDPGRGRLGRHLRRRGAQGIVSNINVLGEAILGEAEAADRLARIEALVRGPRGRTDVGYVSVKLSAVAANLSVLSFDATVDRLTERLERVLRAAAGASPPTFVNVDMEEYRDLALTMAAFQRSLGRPGLQRLEAGIVLQAYLPDSLDALEELIGFALARQQDGGAPIKVRLVKGANLAMERVEAELTGWNPAPYDTKAEVDANYKRLVERALRADHGTALRVGVGSHNLFDVAFAVLLARRRGVESQLDIEMLEGMANAQVEAVAEQARRMVLYTPIARSREFSSALSYLARRLDENTAPQNYLAQLHRLASDPAARRQEREQFLQAVGDRDQPARGSRRSAPPATVPPSIGAAPAAFFNAADTDFTVPANRQSLHQALATYIPVRMSDPPARSADIDAAVAAAHQASRRWAEATPDARRTLLLGVASHLEAQRGRTIAAMVHDAAKVATEADAEVSEAVDFASYYAFSAASLNRHPGLRHIPYGVVLVVSPWNFPYAIAAGGVLAALAAGNAVILKPAPQTAGLGQLLVEQLHQAGIPQGLVQVVHAPEDERGQRLVTHPDIGGVVLTGSAATAELFTGWRPELRLHAETSGKNAMVITATADVDLAVRDLLRSAFGHAGQKCSAASLAIVEAPLLDQGERGPFLRQLRDAVTSLPVGPAADPTSAMGPLIGPPGEELWRALTTVDPGESWLVQPRPLDRTVPARQCPRWSPGVRLGVAPGSWFHRTECFGPVLGIMRAGSLAEATAWQNQVAFGLTGGLHSLSEEEIAWWVDRVEVGNAYVNRSTTGAVVNRQPFGGWKRSVVGPGAKAGGPNYVASLGHWQEQDPLAASILNPAPTGAFPAAYDPGPDGDRDRASGQALSALRRALPAWDAVLVATEASYRSWWAHHVALEHDPSGLRAERNRFRYRPLDGPCLLRLESGPDSPDPMRDPARDPTADLARALLAATVTGTGVIVSAGAAPSWLRPGRWAVLDVVVESQTELADRLGRADADPVARIRMIGPGAASEDLRRAARQAWVPLSDDPVVSEGGVELLRWVREQVLSETRHRHGNPW
ncbi:MAG: proline dehydrogenase family protein [Acidimicrobiales bacterium]